MCSAHTISGEFLKVRDGAVGRKRKDSDLPLSPHSFHPDIITPVPGSVMACPHSLIANVTCLGFS